MRSERTDKERLKKIVKYWDELKATLKEKNITSEDIKNDQFTQWAITTPVFNIGEQVYQVSDELKKRHSNLPWDKISGLRHRLVHDYDNIKWGIIVDALENDMDSFIKEIKKIIKELDK